MSAPPVVGIVGLGLMGGSLARSLARLSPQPRVRGWSLDPADVHRALEEGVVARGAGSAAEAAEDADLIVYATPLSVTLDLVARHRTLWPRDATVTDLASLKAPVVEAMRELGESERYVGAHPMAGGERSGYRSGRADLYDGARVWLTHDTGSPAARSSAEAFWRSVGGEPRWIGSREHDRRMIRASHLPQAVATALADLLAAEEVERRELGPGGRDMTRLAASSPEMWVDLYESSATELAGLLDALAGKIDRLADDLRAGRLEEVAERMRRTREWVDRSEEDA